MRPKLLMILFEFQMISLIYYIHVRKPLFFYFYGTMKIIVW